MCLGTTGVDIANTAEHKVGEGWVLDGVALALLSPRLLLREFDFPTIQASFT